MGFRRAAEILHAAMVAQHSIRDLDTVIFPYAAWMHHAELQLKSLLAQLRAHGFELIPHSFRRLG
jgi:hypothetical protein